MRNGMQVILDTMFLDGPLPQMLHLEVMDQVLLTQEQAK